MIKLALITDQESEAVFMNFFDKKKQKIEEITSQKLQIKYIYNCFPEAELDNNLTNSAKSIEKYEKILADPEIKIIIELTRNEQTFFYLKNALENNKTFISSNRKLLVENYKNIKRLEKKYKQKVYFSAAFSPLPVQTLVKNFYGLDDLKKLNSVLNSTTNYILTEMEKNTISMKETIEEAKESSYTEKNTDFDLNGLDSLYKIVLLLNLFYNCSFNFDNINKKGIKGITSYDLIYASELGYKIKLLTTIKKEKNKLYLGVRPNLISKNNFLASVNENANAVEIFSELNAKTIFKAENTDLAAYNLICLDLVNAVKNIKTDFESDFKEKKLELYDLYHNQKNSFYVRLQLEKDQEIVEKIKKIFSKKNLAELILHDNLTETPLLPVIIISKKIKEQELEKILQKVENLEGVLTINNIIPIKN